MLDDINNNEEEDAVDNISTHSYNLDERMYNVEVQLEEMDMDVNQNINNNNDNNKNKEEVFSTQDCVNMLEDSTAVVESNNSVVNETICESSGFANEDNKVLSSNDTTTATTNNNNEL